MWSNRIGLIAWLGVLCANTFAAASGCPSRVDVGALRPRLQSASVFSGPPEMLGDLIWEDDRWTNLQYLDAYLGCYYPATRNVTATVIIHVKGVSVCSRLHRPFRVVCR